MEMQAFQKQMRDMFHGLATELRQQLSACTHTEPTLPNLDPPRPFHQQQQQKPLDIDMDWETISEELPALPSVQDQSWPKLFKLAKELK
jgi:hypothetical protein